MSNADANRIPSIISFLFSFWRRMFILMQAKVKSDISYWLYTVVFSLFSNFVSPVKIAYKP